MVDTVLRGRPATLPWKMALIAGIIGIPMFFEIGLVLPIPVVMLAVHRSKGPSMRLGIQHVLDAIRCERVGDIRGGRVVGAAP